MQLAICVHGEALDKPAWAWASPGRPVSPLPGAASVRHHSVVTSSSLAGGPGALQPGAGQGCPHRGPRAATIPEQPAMSTWVLVSSRQSFGFNQASFPSLPVCVSPTHHTFANASFLSPYTPPTLVKPLGTPKTRSSTWRNLKIVTGALLWVICGLSKSSLMLKHV